MLFSPIYKRWNWGSQRWFTLPKIVIRNKHTDFHIQPYIENIFTFPVLKKWETRQNTWNNVFGHWTINPCRIEIPEKGGAKGKKLRVALADCLGFQGCRVERENPDGAWSLAEKLSWLEFLEQSTREEGILQGEPWKSADGFLCITDGVTVCVPAKTHWQMVHWTFPAAHRE